MTEPVVRYIPGGQPFIHLGGPVGCLMVHGYTGAPAEVRWMGEYLAGCGLTVLGVRLTGHGTSKEDMARSIWRHWAGNVLDGLTWLHQLCERVYIAGLSMGGLLSLYAGIHYPVDGVISMAAPLQLSRFRTRFLTFSRYVPLVRYVAKKSRATSPLDTRVRTIQKARGEPVIGRSNYPYEVIPSAVNLMQLMRHVEAGLPRLTVPLLLMHARTDKTAPPESMPRIYHLVGSEDKAMHWIDSGDHVITQDIHMEAVFELAWQFIRTREAGHFDDVP